MRATFFLASANGDLVAMRWSDRRACGRKINWLAPADPASPSTINLVGWVNFDGLPARGVPESGELVGQMTFEMVRYPRTRPSA